MSDTPDIVERLQDALQSLNVALLADAAAEIERLRERIVELEAAHATAMGTLEVPPEPEQPFHVTHNVLGNAPV